MFHPLPPPRVLIFHGFVQTYLLSAQKVTFQIFFESYNGFGVSDELWDTIPGFWNSVQKLFSYVLILVFARGDPSCSLWYILIRQTSLWTYFVGLQDKAD